MCFVVALFHDGGQHFPDQVLLKLLGILVPVADADHDQVEARDHPQGAFAAVTDGDERVRWCVRVEAPAVLVRAVESLLGFFAIDLLTFVVFQRLLNRLDVSLRLLLQILLKVGVGLRRGYRLPVGFARVDVNRRGYRDGPAICADRSL